MGEIDLSSLTYDDWVAFFFAQDVDPYGDIWDQVQIARPRHPELLVANLARLCREFASLPKLYSWEQINQGVWAILMHPAQMSELLMAPGTPIDQRIDCIESMYCVYADVIARLDPSMLMENAFHMWWDVIADTFTRNVGHTGTDPFTPREKWAGRIQTAIFSTLTRILALGEKRCEYAAIHGLGHLRHPEGAYIIQHYIDQHREQLASDELEWLEQCRDGTMM